MCAHSWNELWFSLLENAIHSDGIIEVHEFVIIENTQSSAN